MGVDAACIACLVALRKESVDRNLGNKVLGVFASPSLSARRAWIEIGTCVLKQSPLTVALRKESVDRNCATISRLEMSAVALRKESVDRNVDDLDIRQYQEGRSPQGERG